MSDGQSCSRSRSLVVNYLTDFSRFVINLSSVHFPFPQLPCKMAKRGFQWGNFSLSRHLKQTKSRSNVVRLQNRYIYLLTKTCSKLRHINIWHICWKEPKIDLLTVSPLVLKLMVKITKIYSMNTFWLMTSERKSLKQHL